MRLQRSDEARQEVTQCAYGSEQSGACQAVLSTVVRSRQPGTPIRQYIRAAALPSQQQTITKQAIALAASGAVLGPLCDGQHSKHEVLYYVNPTMLNVPICNLQLETCWWVPLLFGFAAVILGVGHSTLDGRTGHHGQCAPRHGLNPPWELLGCQHWTHSCVAQPCCTGMLLTEAHKVCSWQC
ncbi:hypothetical protein WJX77_006995 [Trebouxia sp. C0004]